MTKYPNQSVATEPFSNCHTK